MKSITKLRRILNTHDIDIKLGDNGTIELITIDRTNGDAALYQGLNFTVVTTKAFKETKSKSNDQIHS